MPHKVQLYQQFKDQGLAVISLNMEGEEEFDNAAKILQDQNIAVTNFCLIGGSSEESLAVLQFDGLLPTVNLYDRRGRLRYQPTGLDAEELERLLRELLSE